MNQNEERNEKLDKIVELANESEVSSIKSIVRGIIDIINNPKSGAKDLTELIKIDPPLTAKVLKVANSAYYAFREKISDIKKAIIWIGFDALKELALNQKVCEIFEKDESIEGYSRVLLWKHSFAVALLSKMIYRKEFGERGENIYAAGLLHDIGIIVEDQFLQDDFKLILRKLTKEKMNLPKAEYDVFGYNHAEVGMKLTELWSFPLEIVMTIGHHHNPLEAPQKYSKMALTLYVSDYLCQKNSIGYRDTPFPDKAVFHDCIKELTLQPIAINLIVNEMKQEIEEIKNRELFQNV